ncbi:MAG: hypothetical protein LBI91_08535 [Spirochaetaceae bacterium]|jgi:hypothetical protein|nr:hypothetical protein [Spirochaetaceae bacterium]
MRLTGLRKYYSSPAIFVLLPLFLISCKLAIAPENEEESVEEMYAGRSRLNFQAVSMVNNKIYEVNAVLLAENDACAVYGDPKEKILPSTAEKIAGEYKDRIALSITKAFGNCPAGKTVILLLDIIDGYKNQGDAYTAGYFDLNNVFPKSLIKSSNEMPMLYVDVNPGGPGTDQFYSTIAHELQHLINFYSRYNRKNPSLENITKQGELNALIGSIMQDTWVDEGLSSAAEYIYNKASEKNRAGNWHIQDKINYYNNADIYYTKGQSKIAAGNNFFTWINDDFAYDEYITVYLFFQWLRIQADNDVDIYRSIIESEYTDYRAVIDAACRYIPRLFEGAEFDDREAWERILETWFAANYINAPEKENAALGLFGYNSEFTLSPPMMSGKSISLYPGDGVYSKLAGKTFAYPESPAHIRYAALGKTEIPLARITQGTPGKGDALLTFNANHDITSIAAGPAETGVLADRETVPAEDPAPGRMADLPATPRPIDKRLPIRF